MGEKEAVSEAGNDNASVKDKLRQGYRRSKGILPHIGNFASFLRKHAVILTLLFVIALQFTPNVGGKYPWGGMWLRLEAQNLPLAERAAHTNVENHIRAEASRIAAEQYPNLPDENREKVIKDVMKKVRDDYGDTLKVEKKRVEDEIRAHYSYNENDRSFIYMPDIDTYYYLRHARNVVENGHIYDTIKDGVPWNSHTKAPVGTRADRNWHAYILASLYSIHSFFDDTATLMQSANYFPIVFIFFSIILAFLITWRLAGPFGGFFGATMLALTPTIFGRTTWGHADTDAYNVFFPLLCVWLMIEALVSKSKYRQAVFAVLSGLAVGVFSKFWIGWWYVFDFMMGALVIGFIWSVFACWKGGLKSLSKDKHVKKYLTIGLLLFFTAALFMTFATEPSSFFRGAFKGAIGFTSIKDASNPSLWPNVLTTVAELNPANFFGGKNVQGIVPSIGGILLFTLGVLGVLLLLLKRQKLEPKQLLYALVSLIWLLVSAISYSKGKTWVLVFFPVVAVIVVVSILWKSERSKFERFFYPALLIIGLFAVLYASFASLDFLIFLGPAFLIAACLLFLLYTHEELADLNIIHAALLALWFVGTIYATLKGVRFLLLLGPAFAIAFGVCIGRLYTILSSNAKKYLHLPKFITGIVIFILVCIIITPASGIVKRNYNSLGGDAPLVNDAWWNSLSKIREESAPDAIINSWWDFGHHFKYIADRSVTFDGGSQNSPQAHWIGRVLQTNNEGEAVAILRMLDCGANYAFDTAMVDLNDSLKAVEFVKKIILQDRDAALETARRAGVDEKIVDYTHCEPPENYFIASGDMVGKSQVWSHFGLWDFERAETWLKWKDEPESVAVKNMAERFNWTEDKAARVYSQANSLSSENAANKWISPWISYVASPKPCLAEQEMLDCGNVRINRSSNKVEVSIQGGTVIPGELISYNRKGEFTVLNISEGSDELSVVLWPDGNSIMSLVSLKQLANSIFTRMYYMNGLGLRYFEPFTKESQLISGNIYVYKVDWTGSDPLIPKSLEPKDSVVKDARVRLDYIGFTDDGVFDSSIVDWQSKNVSQLANFDALETEPLAFIYGSGQLISGFEEGLKNMTVGEEKTIVVPPEKAYGTNPEAHPLGNKTLTFRVKIVSIE